MRKNVKLRSYIYEPNETIIEDYEAREWDDFLIIELKGIRQDDTEALQRVYNTFAPLGKLLVILPEGVDMAFHGVVEVEDDNRSLRGEPQHEERTGETPQHPES